MATQLNDWLSVDKASGTGSGYITLTASQSTEPTERSTSLSVKTQTKEVIMTIKQNAFENIFKAYADLISSEWEGSTVTTKIVTNTVWKTITPDWITVSGSGTGLVDISITFSPNVLEEPRTGVIRFLNPSDIEIGTIAVAQSPHNEVNNIIYYTSTDGAKITPNSSTGIITHTFKDGVGAIYYGNEITAIPKNFFRDCKTLQSVSVPSSVTTVENAAFIGCTNLVSCNIPSITTIKTSAFYNCSSLTNECVASLLREGVTSIGDYGFFKCNSILNLVLPNSLTSLGSYAFNGCKKLKELSIGSGLTVINSYTFADCVSLTNVVIPNNITDINDYAFDSCTSMGSLTLGSGVSKYGKYAFGNCGLSYVVLSKRTERKGTFNYGCFGNNLNLTSVYAPDLFTWLCFPNLLLTYYSNVRNLYINNEILTEVVIPEGMSVVNEYAFYKNPNITSVVISDWVTEVQQYAFYGLNNANLLYMGNSLSTIGSKAFTDFEGTLIIDNANLVIDMANNYFKELIIYNVSSSGIVPNSSIEKIQIENDGIFLKNNSTNAGFTNVKTLIVNGKNFGIGDYLFKENLYLWELESENITSIGRYAFYNSQIASIKCDNLAAIGEYAFSTSQITSVKCNNLEIIYNNAFEDCSKLSSVTFRKNISVYNYAFNNCPLITEFNFSKVSFIGDYAFAGTKIAEIKGLENCTSIGIYAFSGTKITKIKGLEKCTSIGSYAFNSTPLAYAELYENNISLSSYAFRNTKLKHIKVLPNKNGAKIPYAFIGGNTVFNTKVATHRNLEIDFWWKNNAAHTGDAWYEILGAGSVDGSLNCFELRYNSGNSNTLQFRVGSSSWSFDISSANWQHFVINNKGLWLNDVKKISFDDYPTFTVGEELYINGVGYRYDRNANGEFRTFTINGVDFIPAENGFINGSTNELLDNVGTDFVYTYRGYLVETKPIINNNTFYGVQQYGYLEYPENRDYSDWLSTSSYYLGYYNWNSVDISANELDFDAQDSYDVVVNSKSPNNWSIKYLPFWLSASVTSGGTGETTITFTKIKDYVTTDNIIITADGFDYKIIAKYAIKSVDFTDVTSYVFNFPNVTSITNVEWLTENIETDKVTLTRENSVYTKLQDEISFIAADGTYKIYAFVNGSKTPMPKADNRIYYTGSIDTNNSKIIYGTNADYVTSGYYGNGLYYIEYDRPILWLTFNFGNGSNNLERISLPSSLQYIDDNCLKDCPNLIDVSLGGDEKYIGSYSFYNCPKLTEITFGGEMEIIGSGAFNNLTTANFLGMTPPRVVSGFNDSCNFYAPIGSDYSSIPYSVEYTLEGIERNRGNESHWLDGNQVNLFIPQTEAKILFYDATTKECSMISLGYTPKNTSDTYLSLSYTKPEENLTTNYQVRNGSAECMIEAIRGFYDSFVPTVNFVIRVHTCKGVSVGEFYEATFNDESSVPSCVPRISTNDYFNSVGDYTVSFGAMGALAPPSCITVRYEDTYGNVAYSYYNFVKIDYRAEIGVKPSVTKWKIDGYMTYK